ncbi:MAG: sensor histidine kinase [Candidatus Fimivivens sp.]
MSLFKIKLDIENKILIPFLIISFLFTSTFGGILFYNGYRAQLKTEQLNARLLLESVTSEIEHYGTASSRRAILRTSAARAGNRLFIYDENGAPLLESSDRTQMREEWVLLSRTDNRYGWTLCYILDRADFYDDLIENQRYMIIATIALLIITVQAGIFIAYNISDPIRRLTEACERISLNPCLTAAQPLATDYRQRRDEIGRLAVSFDSMLADIHRYTDEIVRVKILNEAIVENLPLGVVAYNAQGEQLCINSKAAAMLAAHGLYCDDEPLLKTLHRLIAGSRPVIDPFRAQDPSGRFYDLEIGIWRLTDANGFVWGALCTLDDITYKKMMEEKFSESEKLAHTGKIAADLAHEIRNPLAGVRAGIQVISKRIDGENERTICSGMVAEVDRINLLIENLLNLARERTSHKTLFSVGTLLDEIALLYTKVAENNHIVLRFFAESDLMLCADESQIKQVLINLINNSFRAVGDGGSVTVSAHRLEGGTMLTVADNGAGMTAQAVQSVLSSGRADAAQGRGLGLSIVRRLLRQNGGGFDIQSEQGKGTTIIITFETQEAAG